jgi:hypothetical protein
MRQEARRTSIGRSGFHSMDDQSLTQVRGEEEATIYLNSNMGTPSHNKRFERPQFEN